MNRLRPLFFLILALAAGCAFRDSGNLPPAPVTPFDVAAFDTLYSDKEMGCSYENGRFTFRI
ncbi:MAG: hypothetical protein PHT46_07210, partial [Candidatus Marinimicrobia bacterium]|nr:hypothetical protein [Candidatus Neomarinimicrobiota bacterium]